MEQLQHFTAFFTGHRRIEPAALFHLPRLLDESLTELIEGGFDTFRAGGALGFDTMAALKTLEMKAKYPHIKLHLYLPCRDQDRLWNLDEMELYHRIMSHADAVHYTADFYRDGCMLQRNREMADGCQLCVAYCHTTVGGSAYTLRYAQKKGIQLLNLAEMLPQNNEEGY